jgi:transcriptional regulator of arginine metabolism
VSKVPKNRRQHVIARLLGEHAVTSQAQLVELLGAEGVAATQATVSRDLEDLGAVRVRMPGVDGQVYALAELPKDQVAPLEHLRRVLGEWVVDLSVSANLIVVRTPPGSAHVVASALDRTGIEGVLGTVAGDDTVLIVAEADAGGATVGARLAELAGANGLAEEDDTQQREVPPDSPGEQGKDTAAQ